MKQAFCESQTISLCGEWDFLPGEATLFSTAANHNVCYGMTKAGGWLGIDDTFANTNAWRRVTVPHDWSAELPSDPGASPSGGYKRRGVAWYKKTFFLPEAGHSRAILEFEGIMSESTVYINGTLAGRSFSGYTGFFCDISDMVVWGQQNTVAVRANADRVEGWWYEGAGIYRPVRLHLLPETHFEPQGIFVHSQHTDAGWYAKIQAKLHCTIPSTLIVSIRDKSDAELHRCKQEIVPQEAPQTLCLELPLQNPPLWSTDAPNLLTCQISLENAAEADRQRLHFGVRDLQWSADRGLILNGAETPIRGICCHQDHAGVGVAVPRAVTEYRVRLLKEMGCNAYRCAHHCPSQDLLDACDRQGMLVMVENRHFSTAEEVLRQVDSMVLYSRNHPCVFLYSAFNEEFWARESRGARMTRTLARRIRALDPTRAITGAIHMDGSSLTPENASDAMDITGINYSLADYAPAHARIPTHPILGTENSPTYATRGVYADNPEAHVFSAYGSSAFGPHNALKETMAAVARAPYVAGCFVWCGFDYRGEPAPYEWPSVRSHWGFADSCGFFKDTAYLLKSYYAQSPVLHLLPHWNHAPGESVRVCVFTNLPKVTLFLNGVSLGERDIQNCRGEWTVPFAPGVLQAEGIAATGATLRDTVRTSGVASKLHIVREGDSDTAIIHLEAQDAQGTFVPDFSHTVCFQTENCEILGTGNGNPNGLEADKASEIPCFHGRAQVLLRLHPGALLRIFCGALDAENRETLLRL